MINKSFIASNKNYHRISGFTIVELLIVIVVIGILAGITIVAYNGVQNRAKAGAAQSAASQAAKKIATYAVTNVDMYPIDLETAGIIDTGDTTYQYTVNNSATPKTFCITATKSNISYFITSANSTPKLGGCPGHGAGGVPAITNLAINPHAVTGNGGWGNQTPSGSTTTFEATGAQDGGSAYQVVTTISAPLRINFSNSVGSVSSNDVVAVSLDIFAPAANSAQIEIAVNSTFPKSTVFTISPGWSRVYGQVVIPAGVTNMPVTLVQVVTTAPVAATQTWRASRVLITKGAHTSAYADGFSENWVWNGAQNASTSTGPPL